MFPTLWTVDVLPYAGSAADDYGNSSPSYGQPVPQPVYAWAPTTTDEVTVDRDVATTDLTLLAPASFSCSSRDRVVVDGKTYEVVGDVQDFNHGPFGFSPGIRVLLRRSEAS